MRNKLEEKINSYVAEALQKIDDALDNETRIYNVIRAEAFHTDGNFFRRAVAFFKGGEKIELEEQHTNVSDANSLSEENSSNKNDEARVNTVVNLFNTALAHLNKAKHDIGLYWNQVINSNSLSSEMGYTELLDEATADLKRCERIKIELKKIQSKCEEIQKAYDGIMENIEKIRIHNTTIIKERKQRGKK